MGKHTKNTLEIKKKEVSTRLGWAYDEKLRNLMNYGSFFKHKTLTHKTFKGIEKGSFHFILCQPHSKTFSL